MCAACETPRYIEELEASITSNLIGSLTTIIDEVEANLRNDLADKIMANHLVDFSSPKGVSNHCLREDCTHVEDAMIVRGNA